MLVSSMLSQELKLQQVDFVVAPYEADAQMAYLAKQKEVSAVITEDSDLLAYGCPRVRKNASAVELKITQSLMPLLSKLVIP